jgi:hypothetical protein
MANSANADEALIIEGQLYAWLLQNGHTSEQHANPLASLLKRSGIDVVPNNMKRGKLLNFFEDRPYLFGIVRGTDEAKNISIYAIPQEREGNRGRDRPRGRGGPGRYVRSQEAQELLDAQEQQEQELLYAQEQELFDAQMLNDAIRPNYPPQMTEYNNLHNMHSPFFVNAAHKKGGKSKSKSRSTRKSKTARKSRRKSRSRKNRNRRNKTARN